MISRRALLDRTMGIAAISATSAIAASQSAHAHTRSAQGNALEEILLWPENAPGEGGVTGEEQIGGEGSGFGALSNISTPRMRVYQPNIGNGKAVMVCAGGGYFRLQLWKESTPICQWLQLQGYTVFELISRLPNDGWEASAPFMDAQRAMKIIRTRAQEFAIRPDQIGIMGFSAGGHLAGYTALNSTQELYAGNDQFEQADARPDFAALLFPVVSMFAPYDTTRTRREIIGREPSRAAQEAWSLHSHAASDSPPTIIFSAADDQITPPGHGITLFSALSGKNAPCELHIFEEGGHGWGIGSQDQILNQWPELFDTWINKRNFNTSIEGRE